MSISDQGDPREQHNHGSGTFIGRDNYGSIRNELVDPKTRAVLAKLAQDAPDLANILRKALRDGVISPEAVAALQSAVRHINEDVANSLEFAGRNINEDVANSLEHAARSINEDVANRLSQAADRLGDALDTLTYNTLPSYDRMTEKAASVAGMIERVITPPAAEVIVDWMVTLKLFLVGLAVGAIGGAIGIYFLIKPK